MERSLPNILVTGTPGTGKTTTSEMIAEVTGLEHVNVGEIVKQKQLHEGYLEEFDTHVLDEDKVCAEEKANIDGEILTNCYDSFSMN